MARKDWRYINLDRKLVEEVDRAVKNIAWHGESKYRDAKDYITTAIQEKLDKEKAIKLEVTA